MPMIKMALIDDDRGVELDDESDAVDVPPGVYDVVVQFRDREGRIVAETAFGAELEETGEEEPDEDDQDAV